MRNNIVSPELPDGIYTRHYLRCFVCVKCRHRLGQRAFYTCTRNWSLVKREGFDAADILSVMRTWTVHTFFALCIVYPYTCSRWQSPFHCGSRINVKMSSWLDHQNRKFVSGAWHLHIHVPWNDELRGENVGWCYILFFFFFADPLS